jgi:hypothetical protein
VQAVEKAEQGPGQREGGTQRGTGMVEPIGYDVRVSGSPVDNLASKGGDRLGQGPMSTRQPTGQICGVEKLSAVAGAFVNLVIPTPPRELDKHNIRCNPLQDDARPLTGVGLDAGLGNLSQ